MCRSFIATNLPVQALYFHVTNKSVKRTLNEICTGGGLQPPSLDGRELAGPMREGRGSEGEVWVPQLRFVSGSRTQGQSGAE